MALTAGISAVGERLGGGVAEPVMYTIELVVSFAVLTVLFAAIYKVLPDAEISWRDVWVGAIATALLFVAGKFILGFYLGRSEPGSAFGAAGALAVILVWVYYAGLIILFGAEFTQRWAESRGRTIRPEKGAVRVEEREVELPAAAAKDAHETDAPAAGRPSRRRTPALADAPHADEPEPGDTGAGDGQASGARFIDRVADGAILLAIGGLLAKRVFGGVKHPKPEATAGDGAPGPGH
jgi:membrane protein